MTKIEIIVKDYLSKLEITLGDAHRDTEHTAELSYRAPINDFLTKIAEHFCKKNRPVIVYEPKSQGHAGRPDWLIYDRLTMGVYGYVEAKGISTSPIQIDKYEQQFDRYLQLGHKLIVTDGIEFIFYYPNKNRNCRKFTLVDKENLYGRLWTKPNDLDEFVLILRDFFSEPQPRTCTERSLIDLVALRTKYIAKDIKEYAIIVPQEASNDEEKQGVELIKNLREFVICREEQDDCDGAIFSDYLAQVIMFSLLYAHRTLCRIELSPEAKEKAIRDFATNSSIDELVPFRKILAYILNYNNTPVVFLKIWINETIRFLSYVKLNERQINSPDFHKLYEEFLQTYSPNIKLDYGAYYTPRCLAAYMIKLAKQICNKELNGASFYSKDSTIIDPCCGTGSFLEQAVNECDIKDEFRLCGIEILPAPYMLANYRLNRLQKKREFSFNLDIILANTLIDAAAHVFTEPLNVSEEEYMKVSSNTNRPVKLIIANPPSTDTNRSYTGKRYSLLTTLMEDFRPPKKQRRGRSNIQRQITNPFMLFLRWCCNILSISKQDSILAIVLPSDFLHAPSYKYARQYLQNNFSSAWIVVFDSDRRADSCSNNLFKTQQGRAILILTKSSNKKINSMHVFHWLNISHKANKDKEAFFKLSLNNSFSQFKTCSIDKSFSFIPSDTSNVSLYELCWPVCSTDTTCSVFKYSCSGMKLSPTALFHCVDADMLNRRTRELAGSSKNQQVFDNYFKGQRKPPREQAFSLYRAFVKALGWAKPSSRSEILNYIHRYSFRPYVTSNVLLHIELMQELGSAKNSGMRYRPELIHTFSNRDSFGISLSYSPKHLGSTLHQFASFCWHYPDNDSCYRNNAYVHSNVFYSKDKLEDNINDELLGYYAELLNVNRSQARDLIVFYVYGTLCSNKYLSEFQGSLYIASDNSTRPKIPFIVDANLFLRIARLGKLVALLEKDDTYVRPRLFNKSIGSFADLLPFQLKKVKYLCDESSIALYNRTSLVLKVPCMSSIYNTRISGYNVVEEWVKFHSYAYRKKEFDDSELRSFFDLLERLHSRQLLIRLLDVHISKLLSLPSSLFFMPPNTRAIN